MANDTALGNCKECAAPLVRKGAGPKPIFCSGACRARAGNRKARIEGRDKLWAQAAAAKRQAVREANAKPCPYCGDLMTSARRVQCGKPECERLWANQQNRSWQHRYRAEQGQPYNRRFAVQQRAAGRPRYKERKELGLPRPRKLYPANYAKADAKRRMLKAAATIETFAPVEIFERDNWTCGLCQRPVDKTLTWPDPNSASLDHIVPLSQHGDHSRANTRLAHLGCNNERGNRGGGEQLMLVG